MKKSFLGLLLSVYSIVGVASAQESIGIVNGRHRTKITVDENSVTIWTDIGLDRTISLNKETMHFKVETDGKLNRYFDFATLTYAGDRERTCDNGYYAFHDECVGLVNDTEEFVRALVRSKSHIKPQSEELSSVSNQALEILKEFKGKIPARYGEEFHPGNGHKSHSIR